VAKHRDQMVYTLRLLCMVVDIFTCILAFYLIYIYCIRLCSGCLSFSHYPLVKCKMTDVNNYRAIAITNSISKLLQSVLSKFVQSADVADDYQSRLKRNQSLVLRVGLPLCTNKILIMIKINC